MSAKCFVCSIIRGKFGENRWKTLHYFFARCFVADEAQQLKLFFYFVFCAVVKIFSHPEPNCHCSRARDDDGDDDDDERSRCLVF